MPVYEVKFLAVTKRSVAYLVDATCEDEADELAYDRLKIELGGDIDVRDCQINEVKKGDVE